LKVKAVTYTAQYWQAVQIFCPICYKSSGVWGSTHFLPNSHRYDKSISQWSFILFISRFYYMHALWVDDIIPKSTARVWGRWAC
jgi:hypothetical protein